MNRKIVSLVAGLAVTAAIALTLTGQPLHAASAGQSQAADERHCLHVPLRGAHIVNDNTMALVSSHDEVGLVKLSAPCLKGKHQELSLQLTGFTETICRKQDIEEVLNQQLVHYVRNGPGTLDFTGFTMDGRCAVTDFLFVGHLDKDGMLIDDDGKRIGKAP